jgi:hypothetical protein
MMKPLTPQENLTRAVRILFMQAYGARRYGSHGPTRAQWVNVGAALAENGTEMPSDWVEVLLEEARG